MARPQLPSWILSVISFGLIGFFIIWLTLTYLPVLIVEVKYSSFQLLKSSFGVTDLRSLFIPNFKNLDLQGYSNYQDYGITIPVLNLDEPVVFNVDPNDEQAYGEALKKGIAHASGTSFPDSSGLGYYFAHSSSPELRSQYNAVFYLLGKLKLDDPIYIWQEQKKFKYLVSEIKVTQPEDISFLETEYDNEAIVLQTCWPPGTTSQRLLVFAQRVE